LKQEPKEPMAAREIVGGFFPNLLENLRARTALFEQVRREAESTKERCRECGEALRWDVEETARRRVEGEAATVFSPCSECRVREWMAARGVPTVYRHASFQNWRVECTQDGAAAEKAIAFARNLRGVLIVSGAMGRGRSGAGLDARGRAPVGPAGRAPAGARRGWRLRPADLVSPGASILRYRAGMA
jgi:DNA-directed RNA polymerase subunit M/transcription elongation factor TFIIS